MLFKTIAENLFLINLFLVRGRVFGKRIMDLVLVGRRLLQKKSELLSEKTTKGRAHSRARIHHDTRLTANPHPLATNELESAGEGRLEQKCERDPLIVVRQKKNSQKSR